MNWKGMKQAALLLPLAMVLAACGGGGGGGVNNGGDTGGGDTNTPPDDSADVPTLTLSAKAYDGPLKNATVTVKVGEETYTATTNDKGEFVLEIGSPDPDAMITIVAKGGEGQEEAELISIAGTFGALTAAAGDDGTLDSTESGVVNVTNLSTAKAVLMIEANGGKAPSDDETLVDLEKSIDSSAMLELATVIKLVIDADIPLPDGVTSTLDLVESDAAVDAVIASADAKDANLFDNTLDAILDDPNLSPGFAADEIPGIYFINRPGSFVSGSRGFTAELKDDGTGFIYGSGPDESATVAWTVDSDGKLQVDINDADPFLSSGSCSTDIGLQTCNLTVTALTFSLVIEGAAVDTISMSRTGTVTYPYVALPDETLSGSGLYLAMEPNALEKFTTEGVKGTWSVPLSYPNPDPVGDRYETNLLTFAADGTGTRPQDGVAFTWTIDDDGILHLVFVNDDKLDIYWLRPEGELGMDAMVIMTTAAGPIYTQPHLIVTGVDTDYAGSIFPDGLDGLWHYMDWLGFYYEIESDAGTVTQIYYSSADDETPQKTVNAFTFDGIAAAAITYINADDDGDPDTEPYEGPQVSDCSTVTACYRAYSSTWYPLVKDSGGRIFILEVDEGWWYDGTASGDFYRGAKNYRHGVNRWLGPTGTETEGSSKMSAPTGNGMRGALVRAHLDPLQIRTR